VSEAAASCLQTAGRLLVWRSRRLSALLRTLDHLTDVSWDCYSMLSCYVRGTTLGTHTQPWAHTHNPGHTHTTLDIVMDSRTHQHNTHSPPGGGDAVLVNAMQCEAEGEGCVKGDEDEPQLWVHIN